MTFKKQKQRREPQPDKDWDELVIEAFRGQALHSIEAVDDAVVFDFGSKRATVSQIQVAPQQTWFDTVSKSDLGELQSIEPVRCREVSADDPWRGQYVSRITGTRGSVDLVANKELPAKPAPGVGSFRFFLEVSHG